MFRKGTALSQSASTSPVACRMRKMVVSRAALQPERVDQGAQAELLAQRAVPGTQAGHWGQVETWLMRVVDFVGRERSATKPQAYVSWNLEEQLVPEETLETVDQPEPDHNLCATRVRKPAAGIAG